MIDGNGAYAAILLDGVSYWKVKGLRIVIIAAKDVCVREFALVQSQRELQQESKFLIAKSLR